MRNLDKVAEKWRNVSNMTIDEMRELTEDGNEGFVDSLIEMLRHDVKSPADAVTLENISDILHKAVTYINQEKEHLLVGQVYEKLFPIIDPFSQVALLTPAFS